MLVAIVLVLTCIATLIWYLNHVGQSLRVAGLVGSVAVDTMATLDHTHPAHGVGADPGPGHVMASRGGVPDPSGIGSSADLLTASRHRH